MVFQRIEQLATTVTLYIKARLFSLYTEYLIRRRCVRRVNIGFDQSKAMGILYNGDDPEKREAVHQLVMQLRQLGKQVTVLCYVSSHQQVSNPIEVTVTHRDIRLWGKITAPQAKAFVDTSFDYLYRVDLDSHPILDYLLAQSNAKCRIGYYRTGRTPLFDLMVGLAGSLKDGEVTSLATQMLHYSQLIKTV